MTDTLPRRPLKTLLVATDFSPGAARALERAVTLPLDSDATVHLVHVLPERLGGKVEPALVDEATKKLDELAALAAERAPTVRVVPAMVEGAPHAAIVREARERNAELVVLGRHGKQSLRERLLGTTTERVVRHNEVPSLVVSSQRTEPYRDPMVASDPDDDLRNVQGLVDLALRLAGPELGRLLLLHVIQVPFERRLRHTLGPDEFIAYREQCKTQMLVSARGVAEQIDAEGVRLRPVVRSGDPRQAIVREAKRRQVDLLVLGTHGRTGVAHALIGSVAEWVLRNAPCDVVVQRPRDFRYEAP